MLIKETLFLKTFGILKIPLLFLVNPSVEKLNEKYCEVKIPLNYLTKNHLGSMYFGVLAMGADCAAGLMAVEQIKKNKKKIHLIFKDFKANFLKRAESDVHFICRDGLKIIKQVRQVIQSKKRVNQKIVILAKTPKVSGDEIIAKFELTLSLKEAL